MGTSTMRVPRASRRATDLVVGLETGRFRGGSDATSVRLNSFSAVTVSVRYLPVSASATRLKLRPRHTPSTTGRVLALAE